MQRVTGLPTGSWLLRAAFALIVLAVSFQTASAQYWGRPSWDDRPPYGRPYWDNGPPIGPPIYRERRPSNSPTNWDDDDDDDRPRRNREPQEYGDEVRSGGDRPYVTPIPPRRISFPSNFTVGSIVIDTRGRQLFFVESEERALYYPISVGREGFSWTGTEVVSRKAEWPDWHPPEEMRERDPRLPVKMTGGINNPLGAVAIYLGKTLYRIHGTNDPNSIGRAASSGCFRMLNGHALDLASRVSVGSPVTVVSRLPGDLGRIVAAQVPPQPSQSTRRE